MDVHVPQRITAALRQRGVDVLTAQDDGGDRLRDPKLLDRATQLDRILFTFDSDFLKEAAVRHSKGQHFSGVIILQGEKVDLGNCLADLELICQVYELHEIANQVEYLPL
jgi:predicted nuclease of predicted toxin-antitoxin system